MLKPSGDHRNGGPEEQLFSTLNRPLQQYPFQRLGSAKLPIRPPAKTVADEFVVFLGGDDTYGCHIEEPFPALIERISGVQAFNLGCVGSSLDVFTKHMEILRLCSYAGLVVIEIMGAEAISNRLYRVDERNTQNLLRASKYLKALYSEIDFAQIATISELLTILAQTSNDRLFFVRQELQLAWVARMRGLIRQISAPVILLWISDHEPFFAETGGTVFRDPLFVDRTMIENLRPEVVDIVEFVSLPEEVYRGNSDPGSRSEKTAMPVEVLGSRFHQRVAEELSPIVQEILAAAQKDQSELPGKVAFTSG